MPILRRYALVAAVLSAALSVLAQQPRWEPFRETLADGIVDWDEGYVQADVAVYAPAGAKGETLVNARRVALIRAQAAALRLVLRLPVNSERRLEEYEALRVRVKGVVAGGVVVSEGLEGTKYRLSLRVPINGVKGIASEVAAVTLPPPEPVPEAPSAPAQPKPAPQAGAASPAPATEPPPAEAEATGLAAFTAVAVDAREAGAGPAIQGRIVDPDGNEVYGPATADPGVVRQKTLARYVRAGSSASPTGFSGGSGPSTALALIASPYLLAQREPERKRGGGEVFEVKALSASGPLKSDIVVTRETAEKLRALDAKTGLLREGKVVVVVRADVGGVESRRHGSGPDILLTGSH